MKILAGHLSAHHTPAAVSVVSCGAAARIAHVQDAMLRGTHQAPFLGGYRNSHVFLCVFAALGCRFVIFVGPVGYSDKRGHGLRFFMHMYINMSEGHLMEKPTHLLGNLPSLHRMGRSLTRAAREEQRTIRERKIAKLKLTGQAPIFYVKTQDGKVHGTKALAKSAAYTTRFATALLKIWERDRHGHTF